MSVTYLFLITTTLIILAMIVPIIFTSWLNRKCAGRMTGSFVVGFVICLIVYYGVFFTQAPKLFRPYILKNTHTEMVCKPVTVWSN